MLRIGVSRARVFCKEIIEFLNFTLQRGEEEKEENTTELIFEISANPVGDDNEYLRCVNERDKFVVFGKVTLVFGWRSSSAILSRP